MSKRPKFKRGSTWKHHFDEWWDRRSQEWKAKFFITLGLGTVFALFGLLYFIHRRVEREEILSEAKRVHQSRIEASDKLVAPQSKSLPVPGLRNAEEVQARPAE